MLNRWYNITLTAGQKALVAFFTPMLIFILTTTVHHYILEPKWGPESVWGYVWFGVWWALFGIFVYLVNRKPRK